MLEYRVGEIFRNNGKTYQCVTDFGVVTEPVEGMQFRATNGVLYELKMIGSTCRKCGCDTKLPNNLKCCEIDRQAFGNTKINSLHWYPVEEKGDEKMEEKKRHIELAVVGVFGDQVTFRIAEQTHRKECFTPNGGTFKSYLGHYLMSITSPCYDTKNKTLCVRGSDTEKDEKGITVSALCFAQIMEAINEYNETDGMGYKNQWPRPGDSYYYIDADGSVRHCRYDGDDTDNNRREVGNFFESADDATVAAERVKEVFKTSLVEK